MVRLRRAPVEVNQMVCLGVNDPGPGWWADVKRFWNVSDAPKPSDWLPPVKVKLAAGLCQFCAHERERNATPSLFDTEADE